MSGAARACRLAALEKLADADAFQALGPRPAAGALAGARAWRGKPLPLFAAADAQAQEPEVTLTPMTEGREVVEDYRAVQLSLRAHPVAFLRPELDRRGITPLRRSRPDLKDGDRVEVAGIVLVRQRPGKGNVTFITLEDETGIANAILWQRIFEAQRRIVMSAAMIGVHGMLQREGKVIHVVTDADRGSDALAAPRSANGFPASHRPGRRRPQWRPRSARPAGTRGDPGRAGRRHADQVTRLPLVAQFLDPAVERSQALPDSRKLLRLERTSGQPCETPARIPGSFRSLWVTTSFDSSPIAVIS